MASNFSDSHTDSDYLPESDDYNSDSDTDLSSIHEDDDENEPRPMNEFEVISDIFVDALHCL